MSSGDLENAVPEEEVNFLLSVNSKNQNNINNENSSEALLTREDLLTLDKREPKWRRLRIILLIVFWVVWFGLLTASIIIIVVSPKCPPVPSLNFWQSKVGYWVDPFAFHDSDGDLFGDFKGLIKKIGYIKDTVGAGYLIIGGFLNGQYPTNGDRLGLTTNLKAVDPKLGTNDDFRSMLKAYHKEGLQVVISMDINSVSNSHPWATTDSAGEVGEWFTRSGKKMSAGKYSAFGHDTVDLNLTAPETIKKINDVCQYWLQEGVDGLLLDKAAFYVEDTTRITATNNGWFENANAQIFQSGSVDVVRALRGVIDKVTSKSGKPRLLAVDPGDTGFGVSSPDDSLLFFGTEEQPGAHVVLSRQFVRSRGNKIANAQLSVQPLIQQYATIYAGNESNLVLSTATPSDVYHDNVVSLASIFLLPGSPVLYYGTELGQAISGNIPNNLAMYPQNKLPLVDDELLCHVPMPWDRDGKGFSIAMTGTDFSTLLTALGVKETIESATAAGRGDAPFQLVQSLIKLRKQPSLLWGTFERLDTDYLENPNVEVFVRKAEGYPSFVNVLKNDADPFERVVRLPDYCKTSTPRIIYPASPNLELNKMITSHRVFLKTGNHSAIYVFECHDA